MKKFCRLLSIILLSICFNCTSEPQTYTIETIDGVPHIHNLAPIWGDEPKIELEFIQRIGDLETADENYQLYKPRDVAKDSEGNIYIIDTGNYCVKKYDRNGRFIQKFGNKGQGPGEFSIPMWIFISPDNEVYIWDVRLRGGLHVFNTDGEYRRIFNRDKENISLNSITPVGNFVFRIGSADSKKLVRITDNNMNTIAEFGKVILNEDGTPSRRKNGFEQASSNKGDIFLVFRSRNRLEKYSGKGQPLLTFSRELPYEESEESYPVYRDGQITAYTTNVFSHTIQTDHKNRVWITTAKDQIVENRSKPGSMMFEIYNEEGVLLSRMESNLLALTTSFKIYGDRLFIVDTFKDHCVYEYRINEHK
ncbi:6-bladed beta-propeller [candidate division KSB1 bacterium]